MIYPEDDEVTLEISGDFMEVTSFEIPLEVRQKLSFVSNII